MIPEEWQAWELLGKDFKTTVLNILRVKRKQGERNTENQEKYTWIDWKYQQRHIYIKKT